MRGRRALSKKWFPCRRGRRLPLSRSVAGYRGALRGNFSRPHRREFEPSRFRSSGPLGFARTGRTLRNARPFRGIRTRDICPRRRFEHSSDFRSSQSSRPLAPLVGNIRRLPRDRLSREGRKNRRSLQLVETLKRALERETVRRLCEGSTPRTGVFHIRLSKVELCAVYIKSRYGYGMSIDVPFLFRCLVLFSSVSRLLRLPAARKENSITRVERVTKFRE